MKAVVAHEINKFSVENVDLAEPKASEVLVKMKATGICHSDLIYNQRNYWLEATICLRTRGGRRR